MGIQTSIFGANLTIEEGNGFLLEENCKGCIVFPSCHCMCERVENILVNFICDPRFIVKVVSEYGTFELPSSVPIDGQIVITKKKTNDVY